MEFSLSLPFVSEKLRLLEAPGFLLQTVASRDLHPYG
jgi:hypothetical protein